MPEEKTQPSSLAQALQKSAQAYSPVGLDKYFNPDKGISTDLSDAQTFTPQEMDYMNRFGLRPDPGSNLSERLAGAQTTGDKLLQVPGRLIGSALAKTGEGMGFLAGLANPDNFGDGYIEKAADNYFAQMFAGIEDSVKESFPMFNSAEDREANPFKRMATDLDFWTDEGVDAVAFLASNWLPAGLLSKAGLGAKAVKALKGTKYEGLAGKAASQNFKAPQFMGMGAEDFATGIDKITTTAFMTATESMFEADGVRKHIQNEAFEKFRAGELDEEGYNNAIEYSKVAARDAFLMNAAALSISNYFEAGIISRLMGKSKLSSKGVKGNLKDGFKEAVDGGYKRTLSATAKGILVEGGYEENIQFGIEEVNTDMSPEGMQKTFLEKLSAVGSGMLDVGEYSNDRITSMLLGSIIGGIANTASVRSDIGRERTAATKQVENLTAATAFMKSKDGFLLKKDGQVVLDENEQPVIDDEKVAAANAFLNQVDIPSEVGEVLSTAAKQGDKKAARSLQYRKDKGLAALAKAYHAAGLMDQFVADLQGVKNMTP